MDRFERERGVARPIRQRLLLKKSLSPMTTMRAGGESEETHSVAGRISTLTPKVIGPGPSTPIVDRCSTLEATSALDPPISGGRHQCTGPDPSGHRIRQIDGRCVPSLEPIDPT